MKNHDENIVLEAQSILKIIHEKRKVKIDWLEEENFSHEAIKIAQNNQSVSTIPTNDWGKDGKTSYWLCSLNSHK